MINKLTEIGFKKVGKWRLKGDALIFEIDQEFQSKQEVIYAFESGGHVYYVGKTDKTLKERMTNYKNGLEGSKSGVTNKSVRRKILNLLNESKEVNIYLLSDVELDYKGYKVSVSSGIELALTKILDPEKAWNTRNVIQKNSIVIKPIKEFTEESEGVNLHSVGHNGNMNISFPLKLGLEYFSKGIINIPVKYSANVPEAGGISVKILLDKTGKVIHGTFTRSGTTTKINGFEPLKDWYKKNIVQGDRIIVEIISPTMYRLLKSS